MFVSSSYYVAPSRRFCGTANSKHEATRKFDFNEDACNTFDSDGEHSFDNQNENYADDDEKSQQSDAGDMYWNTRSPKSEALDSKDCRDVSPEKIQTNAQDPNSQTKAQAPKSQTNAQAPNSQTNAPTPNSQINEPNSQTNAQALNSQTNEPNSQANARAPNAQTNEPNSRTNAQLSVSQLETDQENPQLAQHKDTPLQSTWGHVKSHATWKTVWLFLSFILALMGLYTYWRTYAYLVVADEEVDTTILLAVEQTQMRRR
jgi:hypothetical protein